MIHISAIYGKGNWSPKREWDFSMGTSTGQGAEMDTRSHALNAYILKNLNVKIYQNEMYQTKSILKRDFSPSQKVVVTIKISGGFGPQPQKFRFRMSPESPRPPPPGDSQAGSWNHIWTELDIQLILFSIDSSQIKNILSPLILSPEKQGHLWRSKLAHSSDFSSIL